jgi:hypothetical protein
VKGVGVVVLPGRARADGTRTGKRIARRKTFHLSFAVGEKVDTEAFVRKVTASRVVDEILARHYGLTSDFEAAE